MYGCHRRHIIMNFIDLGNYLSAFPSPEVDVPFKFQIVTFESRSKVDEYCRIIRTRTIEQLETAPLGGDVMFQSVSVMHDEGILLCTCLHICSVKFGIVHLLSIDRD